MKNELNVMWKEAFVAWYKVKVQFTLEHAMKVQRGSRVIVLLFL
jgi:hypothetical protein